MPFTAFTLVQELRLVRGLFVQALQEETTPKPSLFQVVSLREQLDATALNFEGPYIQED